MLLALDATTKSIVAFGGNANATNISFVAVYADSSGTAFTEGVSDGILQASAYVTVVAAPSAGVRRIIKSITFYNNYSGLNSVILELDNNGTKRRIINLSLGAQQTWSSDDLGSAGTFKLVNASTPIEGGTSGNVLYNNNGIVSEIARTGTSILVSSVSPTIATPTLITPTVQDSIASTSLGFNLINTTATTVNFAGAAQTLNIGGAASSITSLSAGSGSVVNLGGGANAAELRFLEPSGSGTNYTALKAQAQAANVTYTLPAADGSNGQVLATNGSGVLSWAAGGTGGGGGTTFKNYIINGDFRISQRGATFNSTTPYTGANNDNVYTCDQWILLSNGNNRVNVTQSSDAPSGFVNSVRLEVNSGAGNNDKGFGIMQILENESVAGLLGKKGSLSFYAKRSGTSLNSLKAAILSWEGDANILGTVLDGTVSVSGTTMSGSGTSFNSSTQGLAQNDVIVINNRIYTVASTPTSATSATVNVTTSSLTNQNAGSKCVVIRSNLTDPLRHRDPITSWGSGSGVTFATSAISPYTTQKWTAVSATNTNLWSSGNETTWTRYSITDVDIPSATTAKNIAILIYSDDVTTTAGDALFITGVQLEQSSSVTEYEWLPRSVVQNQCNFYFVSYGQDNNGNSPFAVGATISTVESYVFMPTPAMRPFNKNLKVDINFIPAVTAFFADAAGTARLTTNLQYQRFGAGQIMLKPTVASGQTAGQTVLLYADLDTARVWYSLEL